jgi:hypothetical protein
MDFYLGLAIVFATLAGPVLAVLVTRYIDSRSDRKRRQTDVFRALMRSRRSFVSPEYVAAFNTVEIEFAGVKSVENAQRELLQHINAHTPQPDWFDRYRRLQTRLLYAIAAHLGYEMAQLDVLEGGYVPSAWGTNEEQQQAIQQSLRDLLAGKRTLRVEVVPPNTPSNILPLKPDAGPTSA